MAGWCRPADPVVHSVTNSFLLCVSPPFHSPCHPHHFCFLPSLPLIASSALSNTHLLAPDHISSNISFAWCCPSTLGPCWLLSPLLLFLLYYLILFSYLYLSVPFSLQKFSLIMSSKNDLKESERSILLTTDVIKKPFCSSYHTIIKGHQHDSGSI